MCTVKIDNLEAEMKRKKSLALKLQHIWEFHIERFIRDSMVNFPEHILEYLFATEDERG